ncbi:MAG: sensor histidine kinase, partial [Bacteroidetes bacterium]
DRIQGNVRNLTNILDDFLSLSKLEEGKIEVEAVCFDATSFCRDISEEMQGQARKGQEILFSQEGSSEIQADKKLLRNVLLNLLSNAVKYSPEDTRIFLRLFVRAQEVLIEVEDQGIGIPKEEQAHLFQRFYRAKNATHIQGTGLGLNILQKYVALMEGQVEFRSEVGKGTLFRVTLPQ